MKKQLLLLLFPLQIVAQQNFVQYVDPFIGTGGHGHTFPGATVPFGMVQLSPDTRLSGWDGCSGYHYSDTRIYGFSHTHLSGTGASDYGDVLLMPVAGKPQLSNKKYSSTFKKQSEKASAGYYSVYLDKPQTRAELTTTTRCGLHKYTFEKGGPVSMMLDLTHRDRVKQGEINIAGNNEITGERISSHWADNQMLYFVIQFSKPFGKSGIAKAGAMNESLRHDTGSFLKAFAQFDMQPGEVLYVRVGLSAVSIEGARKNLLTEMPDFDFEKVKQQAEKRWNNELTKIEVETADEHLKRTFYTALYHCMIAPNVYQDVDGKYRGRDFKVHEADFTYYTVFSLWDTYRTLHPLLTLIDRRRTTDFINTFIRQYEEGGRLPVWELSSCETWCMIGYHAIPVIYEAYSKGVTGFDVYKAYEAMRFSAMEDKNALKNYKANGYINYATDNQDVSRTLEYAYDDWCIAMMAHRLGKMDDYEYFLKRAQSYRNIFDKETGFMRPRSGSFLTPFNPFEVNHHYTEANAWQYSFYVPHDLSGHIELLGGRDALDAFLDSLFNAPTKLAGHKQPDITGLIGQYVHGNEPSHQIAYEYNYAAKPWKTQAMVRRICREMYTDKPDGLAGNEDCGQMSAWLVMSALGFYPVCPGSDHYAIGSPMFDRAVIHFENGKEFVITANAAQHPYIQSAFLNGKPYRKSFLRFDELEKGGSLHFNMNAQPNMHWGAQQGEVPETFIK